MGVCIGYTLICWIADLGGVGNMHPGVRYDLLIGAGGNGLLSPALSSRRGGEGANLFLPLWWLLHKMRLLGDSGDYMCRPRQESRLSCNYAVQRRAGVAPAPLGRQSERTIRSALAPHQFVRRYETACSNQSPTAGWAGGTPALLSTASFRLRRLKARIRNLLGRFVDSRLKAGRHPADCS